MGIIVVKVQICKPEKPRSCDEVELLADTGAMYSVVLGGVLKKNGYKTSRETGVCIGERRENRT